MINKALDLPFDEPQETYSTSEHLFHDQGIPPGTKGRIVDPAPVERAPRSDRNDRSDRSRSGRGDSSGDRSGSGDRPARNRDRSRTRRRGGETVAEGGGAATTAPGTASTAPATATDAVDRGRIRRGRQRHPQPEPPSSPPVGRVQLTCRTFTQHAADPSFVHAAPREQTTGRRLCGDDDRGAERGEAPQGDGVGPALPDAAVGARRAELVDGLHGPARRRPGCRGSRSRRCRPGRSARSTSWCRSRRSPTPARSGSRPRTCRGRGCRRGCRRRGRCGARRCPSATSQTRCRPSLNTTRRPVPEPAGSVVSPAAASLRLVRWHPDCPGCPARTVGADAGAIAATRPAAAAASTVAAVEGRTPAPPSTATTVTLTDEPSAAIRP